MKDLIKVAAVQIASKKDDATTIKKMAELVRRYNNCQLIVFPEFILSDVDDKELKRVKSISSKNKVCIVFGGIEKEGKKRYDTSFLVEKNKVHKYRKAHVHWSEKFASGNVLEVFETSLGKIGMLICFDSAFVETTRVLALKGAEIVTIVAASPIYFDVKQEVSRIPAIAVTNQVFVIYVNKPVKDKCNGHSTIVSPKGHVLASAGSNESIITSVLNYDDLKEWRREEKVYQYRRPGLYKEIIKGDNS